MSTTRIVTTSIISTLHECPNCQQKFRKIGSYRRHLRSHLNIHAYKCKHCLISYLSKSQLIAHMEQRHQGEKQYTCSLCNQKFHHSIGFRKHKSEHLSVPPYQCFRCDAVFPSISKQMIHITNHTMACPFCRKAFASEDDLWQHTSVEHKEDREDMEFLSETSECDESDSNDESNENFNEVDVESDADSYTSVELDSDADSPKEASIYSPESYDRTAKGHVCFICERRFPKQRSLENHMKSHKIHSCSACPKFFAHASELKTHRQEHLQNDSSFYSNAFNDLQLNLQQQPPPMISAVPFSSMGETQATFTESGGASNDSSSFGIASQSPTTDFISWYDGFKEIAKHLKYPIGYDLYQNINQIIGELASTLYSCDKVSQVLKDSYVKIYNELTSIIAKNAEQYLA